MIQESAPASAEPSAPVRPSVLEVDDISVVLGGMKVLEVPELKVISNEVLVVIGPNGSGKTTLLLTLAGLIKPASGKILYGGRPAVSPSELLKLHRRLAVAFQDPLLLSASVRDNVAMGLRLRGVDKKEARLRTDRWLERFGIASLAGRQAKTLSGGEAKRTSLARAFALQPEVLFLDEAFNGLDSQTRESIIRDFQDVLGETRTTTVMVTHDTTEALALAHRIIIIMNGRIRQVGECGDVFSNPVDEEVAAFVGVENILRGTVAAHDDGIAVVAVGETLIETVSSYPVSQKVTLCIRPEEITLSRAKASTSARNSFAGEIIRVVPAGVLARIELDCGFHLVALITKRSAEELEIEKGRRVYAGFKATGISVIKRQ